MVLSNQHLNTFLNHLAYKHNIDLAKEMSDFVVDNKPESNRDKIQFVLMAVSEISGVSVSNLVSKDRKAEYTIWKHLVRYICIMNGFGTLKFIATEVGHKDHSTILASRNKVNELLDTNDRQMTECFNKIKHLINATNKKKETDNSSSRN